jgi:diguanylate cyclase (GGDEF)-like protein
MRPIDLDRRVSVRPLWGRDGRWRSISLWLLLIAGWLLTLWFSHSSSALWMPNSWALGLSLLATWKSGPRAGIAVRLGCEAVRWTLLPAEFWTASAGWQAAGALLASGLLIVWVDRRRSAWQREHEQARLDPLTQLPNRQAFEEQLKAELSRASRFRRPVSVLVLDCDGFKAINDHLGHAAGDAALRKVAQTLRSSVRQYDIVARYGGDEFVLVLPETDVSDAETVAERLQATFAHAVSKQYPGLTASLGVAVFRESPPEAAECFERADAAMYRAKRAGKNRTEFDIWEPAQQPAEPTRVLKPYRPPAEEAG